MLGKMSSVFGGRGLHGKAKFLSFGLKLSGWLEPSICKFLYVVV